MPSCGAQDAPRVAGLAFVPLGLRGDGAPSGATFFSFAAPLLRGTRAPLGAPSWRFLLPGSALLEPAFARANAASSSRRGHSAPRSGPGASRVRGYEPRPRAPPLLPFPEASCRTPSVEKVIRNISLLQNIVKSWIASRQNRSLLDVRRFDIPSFCWNSRRECQHAMQVPPLFHCCADDPELA